LKSCLNQDTLKSTATDSVIRIAKTTGYDAIEFAQDKIEAIVKEGTLKNLVRLINDQGIEIASVQGPEPFNLLNEHDFETMIGRAKVLADVAREVGTDVLVPVASMVKTDLPREEVELSTARSLERLAKACGDDIRLGMEFLGFSDCSINNLDQAIRVVEKVNLPNVGLTVDTFHVYISRSDPARLSRLGKNGLVLVHVNDSEPGDIVKLADSNRVFLGEGAIPLAKFRDSMVSASYDGYVSLELLRPEYWERDPEEVARHGREGLRTIFNV
jgi:2-keto-myo-inositol isomerase